MKRQMIHFPFERNKNYQIERLLEFEAELFDARQSDPVLSDRLREPTDSEWWWIKLRHEELLPLLCLVHHGKFSNSAIFRIMPSGDTVDLQIRDGNQETKLQVTVADPLWRCNRRGSQHHLQVALLNTGEIVPGFGPYKREEGKVTGRDSTLSGEELDRSYGVGLKEALKRKSQQDGSGRVLVVFCRAYGEAMSALRFRNLTNLARASCPSNSFVQTWFVDRAEGFFVED